MAAGTARMDRWGFRQSTVQGVFPGPKLAAALAAAVALGIFVVDTATPTRFAVAVLYVIVVLLAGSCCGRRGIILVAVGCMALSIVSFALTHGLAGDRDAALRCAMGLAAIAITAMLVLRNERVTAILAERASLLDLTHDTVSVRDMDDVITYWNRGAEQLYGWSRQEAVGQRMHELVGTEFLSPPEVIEAELLRTGCWEGELVHTRRDGSRAHMASRWHLQRNREGRPVVVLETNNDIADRKRAELALQQTQAELAHVTRLTTLGELTASIAHEVNQPLAGIVTHGEACLRWLNRAEPQLDEVHRAVTRMIDDGRRASEVIRKLRALSKRAEVQPEPQDLDEVLGDALALVQRELSAHRVSLRFRHSAGRPIVLVDRIHLQQVVINLVLNAIQALDGIVDRPRELWVRTAAEGPDRVRIEVGDNGVGIDPADRDRLFDPFFTTKADGLGMGLSISRSIVEAHGGRIWAADHDGPGVSFHLTLPVAAP